MPLQKIKSTLANTKGLINGLPTKAANSSNAHEEHDEHEEFRRAYAALITAYLMFKDPLHGESLPSETDITNLLKSAEGLQARVITAKKRHNSHNAGGQQSQLKQN